MVGVGGKDVVVRLLSHGAHTLQTVAEAKMHDDHLIMMPEDVRESLGLRIGGIIDFVVEKEKAVLYPKRGDVASVRRLHGIIKHTGTVIDKPEAHKWKVMP
jgi:bifunctional DNA-binding transcriptional regulator/antitoxin component of YhaV-PrlF toxin-antitoxin module